MAKVPAVIVTGRDGPRAGTHSITLPTSPV
jgi:hypothetical protein